MRVSQLVLRLRDRLDETTANTYTDVELVRYLDESVMDLFRLQVQHDESYHNCEHDIVATVDGREVNNDIWLYDLPTWVHKITSVRVQEAAGDNRGLNIPARTMHNIDGTFWAWNGFNRIMVHGTRAGEDLTIECSKVPAPMNGGTLVTPDTLVFSTTSIHFDQTSATESLYESVFETDMYKNSLVEFTGLDSGSHAITGSLVRVESSSVSYDTDAIFTTMNFDKAVSATPTALDSWEMHSEVPTSSSGYMIALAAHKAFIRKSNFEAIAALVPDLERERNRFIEAVTPRQDQVLPYAGMSADPLYDRDLDRDESW